MYTITLNDSIVLKYTKREEALKEWDLWVDKVGLGDKLELRHEDKLMSYYKPVR